MSAVALSRRLRKIEARHVAHKAEDSALFVWGTDEAQIGAALSGLDASSCPVARIPWPFDDAPPVPRRATVSSLSDRELEAVMLSSGAADAASRRRALTMSDAELGNAIIASFARVPASGACR